MRVENKDFVEATGTSFEIIKTLAHAVKERGGASDDIRRFLKDDKLVEEVAILLLSKGDNYFVPYEPHLEHLILSLKLSFAYTGGDERRHEVSQKMTSEVFERLYTRPEARAFNEEVRFSLMPRLEGKKTFQDVIKYFSHCKSHQHASMHDLLSFQKAFPNESKFYWIFALGACEVYGESEAGEQHCSYAFLRNGELCRYNAICDYLPSTGGKDNVRFLVQRN